MIQHVELCIQCIHDTMCPFRQKVGVGCVRLVTEPPLSRPFLMLCLKAILLEMFASKAELLAKQT